jgi:hypothetical protein
VVPCYPLIDVPGEKNWPPLLLVVVGCKFVQAWPGVPVFPSQPRGVVGERVIVDSVLSCLFPAGLAGGPSLVRDVEERWLDPVGNHAKNALVGGIVR